TRRVLGSVSLSPPLRAGMGVGAYPRELGRCAALSEDGSRLAAVQSRQVAVFEGPDLHPLTKLETGCDRARDIALSGDGKVVACVGTERAEVLDVAGTKRLVVTFENAGELAPSAVGLSREGDVLVLAGPGRLSLVDTHDGKVLKSFATFDARPLGVAISP